VDCTSISEKRVEVKKDGVTIGKIDAVASRDVEKT